LLSMSLAQEPFSNGFGSLIAEHSAETKELSEPRTRVPGLSEESLKKNVHRQKLRNQPKRQVRAYKRQT
jgi:hypothetical protein